MTTTKRIERAGIILLTILSVITVLVGVWGSTSASAAQPPTRHRETYSERLHRLADDVWKHGAPCTIEDGSEGPVPCYWNATDQGNGYGTNFVILNGGRDRQGYFIRIFVYRDRIVRDGGY